MGVGPASNKTWSSKLLGSRSGQDWIGPQWGWARVESWATANRAGSPWIESVLSGSFELLSRCGDKNAAGNGLNP
ncbi:hypothetical protein V6N13_001518 [Hibiscus sabdariffa]